MLSARGVIDVRVFYTWGRQVMEGKFDPGFGKVIKWDIPLLEGYDSQFLENRSLRPGSDHFGGIDNPDILKELDAWQPDVLLVQGWNFKSHLAVMRHYSRRLPVFFRGDSTLLNDKPGIKSIVRKFFLRWVYSHVDKAFYVGVNSRNYYLNANMKESQLVFAPHAVDNQFFGDRDGDYSRRALEWRRELGIPEDAVIFLYAGKLEPVKSLSTLVGVFNRPTVPADAHLVIIGNGPLEGDLKNAAASDRIHFLGFQNQGNMPVVYRLGNIYVLPSVSETWGLALNESMACGRPVIASSQCGAAADLIVEGRTGYSFRAGDVDDLEKKVMLVMNDRQALAEMGRNALQHIQGFSIKRIADAMEKAVLDAGKK